MLSRIPKKPCKYCKEPEPNHFPYQCRLNPKYLMRTPLKRTPIRKIGKYTKQWFKDRETWKRQNPPDGDGRWQCYLFISPYCTLYVTKRTLTLDHVVARSRAPSRRSDQTNFKPACRHCNKLKASDSLEVVLHRYKENHQKNLLRLQNTYV